VDHPGYADFRARRDETVWQRMTRIVRALLILAAILIIVSLFLPQHKKLQDSHAEVEALKEKVSEQKMILARQTREVNLLINDPEYLAMIARDRLDLMKPGETIFRLEQPEAAKRK
jgi:cell division protein FtsB